MCPDNISQIARCKYWSNPWEFSTPDYFNDCDLTNLTGVPNNFGGHELAHNGFAYAGIYTSVENINHQKFNFREYIEGRLSSQLVGGKKYDVEFWVSAYDSMKYVSSNIAAYFPNTFIYDTCNLCIMPYSPQIENDTSNHLYSRVGWTKISGSFIASGGEQYIIIGNFKDTSATKTIYTGWTTQNNGGSAYYIDDVSVSTKDTLDGINEIMKNRIIVFPNPSSSIFNVSFENEIISLITLRNVLGEQIILQIHSAPTRKVAIDLSNYPQGTYFLILNTIDNKQYQTKLFKQ
jgi:hypothetical protein